MYCDRQCSLGERAGGITQGYCRCLSRLVPFILNGSQKTLPGYAACTSVDAVDHICLFLTSFLLSAITFLLSAIIVLNSRLCLADVFGGTVVPLNYPQQLRRCPALQDCIFYLLTELSASELMANSIMERSRILE